MPPFLMENDCESSEKLNLMLLRESIWELDDKLNVIMESTADHEAEIVRFKRLISLLSDRVSKIETRTHQHPKSDSQ
jgi:hypothetical protein